MKSIKYCKLYQPNEVDNECKRIRSIVFASILGVDRVYVHGGNTENVYGLRLCTITFEWAAPNCIWMSNKHLDVR